VSATFQELLSETAEVVVVAALLAFDSQVTFPEESFLMYLKVKDVLVGTLTAPDQTGYPDDDSATAFDVSQLPSASMEPTT
jgi:hypothetical protein